MTSQHLQMTSHSSTLLPMMAVLWTGRLYPSSTHYDGDNPWIILSSGRRLNITRLASAAAAEIILRSDEERAENTPNSKYPLSMACPKVIALHGRVLRSAYSEKYRYVTRVSDVEHQHRASARLRWDSPIKYDATANRMQCRLITLYTLPAGTWFAERVAVWTQWSPGRATTACVRP